MGSENSHGCAQNEENGFGFEFWEQYHKDVNEFLNHIVKVTGDETYVLFLNVETKEKSKQWVHTRSSNKPKKFKQRLSACQKAGRSCFLGQETSADGGIHATKDHNNIRRVLRNNKKRTA
jgi:hypothetical protein